jgi:RNA polymerase sigma factor (sigma-70 family)
MLNFNTEEAGFVLSDVFIKAYEYIKRKDIENIKWLLYKIAHNTTIDRIKVQKDKHPTGSNDLYINHEDSKDKIEKLRVNTKYKSQLLEHYLGQLDEKYRSVLYLNYYENKSYDEIAIIEDSNKNTIWTLVFQWKRKLEDLLRNTWLDINIFLE